MRKSQNTALKEAIKSYTFTATGSTEKARETLVKEGIYRKNGKLSDKYKSKSK